MTDDYVDARFKEITSGAELADLRGDQLRRPMRRTAIALLVCIAVMLLAIGCDIASSHDPASNPAPIPSTVNTAY